MARTRPTLGPPRGRPAFFLIIYSKNRDLPAPLWELQGGENEKNRSVQNFACVARTDPPTALKCLTVDIRGVKAFWERPQLIRGRPRPQRTARATHQGGQQKVPYDDDGRNGSPGPGDGVRGGASACNHVCGRRFAEARGEQFAVGQPRRGGVAGGGGPEVVGLSISLLSDNPTCATNRLRMTNRCVSPSVVDARQF